MHNNLNNQHRELLQKLKGLVNDRELLAHFNDYLDYLISNQHKNIEQADDTIIIHRTQGAIQALKRLKLLKDEVNAI